MKETRAQLYIEVLCTCPNCDYGLDIFDDIKDILDDDHRASNIDKEIVCEGCGETFLLTDVDF